MKLVTLDQFEFASTASCEALEIRIASLHQFPDIAQFLYVCDQHAQIVPGEEIDWAVWQRVAKHVHDHGGIDLPSMRDCRVHVIANTWDELVIAIEVDHFHIWYHWSTGA